MFPRLLLALAAVSGLTASHALTDGQVDSVALGLHSLVARSPANFGTAAFKRQSSTPTASQCVSLCTTSTDQSAISALAGCSTSDTACTCSGLTQLQADPGCFNCIFALAGLSPEQETAIRQVCGLGESSGSSSAASVTSRSASDTSTSLSTQSPTGLTGPGASDLSSSTLAAASSQTIASSSATTAVSSIASAVSSAAASAAASSAPASAGHRGVQAWLPILGVVGGLLAGGLMS